MILRVPDYYSQFRCLASSCPRSCCVGWEVEIDDDTAAAYAAVPGPLGNELRARLQTDEEGAPCFPLSGQRCPFLDAEDLCRIHREIGQEYTSITCREHPRFTEDFGPLQEVSLSASCPEAARLLLAEQRPLTFRDKQLPEEGEEGDPWLEPLLAVRNTTMTLLAAPGLPIRQRMAQALALAMCAQELLDEDRAEALPALCREPLVLPPAEPDTPGLFPAFWDTLAELEILEDDWLPLLNAAQEGSYRLPETALERLTEYFLFRWLLKAINDGDLLGRMQLSIASALTVERLAGSAPSTEEALYRYCREIEHCQENIDALLEAFQWEAQLFPEVFLHELQND